MDSPTLNINRVIDEAKLVEKKKTVKKEKKDIKKKVKK